MALLRKDALECALPTPPNMRVRSRRSGEGGQSMPRESTGRVTPVYLIPGWARWCIGLRLALAFRCWSFGMLILEIFQYRTGTFIPPQLRPCRTCTISGIGTVGQSVYQERVNLRRQFDSCRKGSRRGALVDRCFFSGGISSLKRFVFVTFTEKDESAVPPVDGFTGYGS